MLVMLAGQQGEIEVIEEAAWFNLDEQPNVPAKETHGDDSREA